MTRGVSLLVGEILEAIALIQGYTRGLTFPAFAASREKQDAVVRRLIIIGEAVKALPDAFRAEHPELPWRDIAGARDILIHEYFRVDLELAWAMVETDLPILADRLRAILDGEGIDDRGAL